MGPAVETLIESRSRELTEGFKVRRVLPSTKRRMAKTISFSPSAVAQNRDAPFRLLHNLAEAETWLRS
jgi:hypothetical protein